MDEVEVLLVEDSPEDAELTIGVLSESRLANRLVHVKDGAEALDFLFGENGQAVRQGAPAPKLVLLDLKLPKVDGMEVLARMKGDARLKTVPVVVLTSSKEEGDILRSHQLGVNSYIVKPVDFDQFARSVRELGLYWLVLNNPPR